MVTYDEFVKRWARLPVYIRKRVNKLLKDNQETIVKMVQDQHHAGIGSDGAKMQSGYSKGYAQQRKRKGLQTSYVDLHFSGRMHKGMKVIPVKDGVDVRSREPYEYYVRARFPKGFSLTAENAFTIGEIVAAQLAVDIKTYLTQ